MPSKSKITASMNLVILSSGYLVIVIDEFK